MGRDALPWRELSDVCQRCWDCDAPQSDVLKGQAEYVGVPSSSNDAATGV
jgi:hypothetical protein